MTSSKENQEWERLKGPRPNGGSWARYENMDLPGTPRAETPYWRSNYSLEDLFRGVEKRIIGLQ